MGKELMCSRSLSSGFRILFQSLKQKPLSSINKRFIFELEIDIDIWYKSEDVHLSAKINFVRLSKALPHL